jgi:hypothetical protein
LNVGTYNISVGIGFPGIEVLDRQCGPSFTLHDIGGFGTLKEKNGRAGLLLTEARWHYRKWANRHLDESDSF